MKMRAWISTIASASAFGSALFAQSPPSGSTAALAAQTGMIHPANQNPTFTMRTAGQPDRAVRVLKMSEGDADPVAEVQDVQSGHTFTMPGKVVKAMLAGTKPPMPVTPPAPQQPAFQNSPTPSPQQTAFQNSPTTITPTQKAMPAAVGAPVFQPNRIASSICERPPLNPVAVTSELPTVTAIQAIVPNPTVPTTMPRIEPVPEDVKPTLIPPMAPATIVNPIVAQPTAVPPVEEPKAAPPTVVPIAKLVVTPEPAPPAVVPIAKIIVAPELAPPAVVPIAKMVVAPVPAPVVSKPVVVVPPKTAEPLFGTPLQTPQPTNTTVKTTPVQVWQPIVNPGSPAPVNNSLWQPIAEPTVLPAKPVEKKEQMPPTSMNVEPKTTTVTTSCCFESNTCCNESAPKQQVNPLAMVERCGEKTSGLAQLEAQVREASQSTIYDLYTATKPIDREEAATKLSEGRFAHRPEVKAAILKAAIADPAPSVRAHCIECLMKLGHSEVSFRLHLKGVASDGPKIVQAAAQTALAQLPPE